MKTIVAGMVGGLLLAGCRTKPEPHDEPSVVVAPSATPAASLAAPAPVASAAGKPKKPEGATPGALYVPSHYGINFVLADGTVGVIKNVHAERVLRGADDKAYAFDSTTKTLSLLEGDKAKSVTKVEANVRALAVDKDGHPHVLSYDKTLQDFDGKSWTSSKPPNEDADHVVCDAAGRTWVWGVAGNAFVRDHGTWTDVGHAPVAIGTFGGKAVAASATQLQELTGGKLVPFGSEYPLSTEVTFSQSGVLVAPHQENRSAPQDLVLMTPGGGSESMSVNGSGGVVDDSGRLYRLDDGVLSVTPLLGGEPTVYPIGTLPAVDGVTYGWDLDDHAIAVGAGPTLPPVGEVRKAAGLKGKIMVGGKPAAKRSIEICVDAFLFVNGDGGSACDKKSKLATTTDDKGAFSFGELPVARYDLAMTQEDGKWATDRSIDIDLVAGKTKDLGTIRYDK